MVILSKLYTRTGDGGKTRLTDGSEISKASRRVAAYGALDELLVALGTARSLTNVEDLVIELKLIQNALFTLGAHLATPAGVACPGVPPPNLCWSTTLEKWIDAHLAQLPPLNSFVIPGGSSFHNAVHEARVKCRRCERDLVELCELESVDPAICTFINRLSDYLFALTRLDELSSNQTPLLWDPKLEFEKPK